MECPENLDAFLTDLLRSAADENAELRPVALDTTQRAFIEGIMQAVTTGSKSVFIVQHPDDRLQYLLLNTDCTGAITLLATVMQRTGEALEADVD